jgi:hypothetical protein
MKRRALQPDDKLSRVLAVTAADEGPLLDLPLVAGEGRELGCIFENGGVEALATLDDHRTRSDDEVRAITAEIVRRVNGYDALLAALDQAHRAIRKVDCDAEVTGLHITVQEEVTTTIRAIETAAREAGLILSEFRR